MVPPHQSLGWNPQMGTRLASLEELRSLLRAWKVTASPLSGRSSLTADLSDAGVLLLEPLGSDL